MKPEKIILHEGKLHVYPLEQWPYKPIFYEDCKDGHGEKIAECPGECPCHDYEAALTSDIDALIPIVDEDQEKVNDLVLLSIPLREHEGKSIKERTLYSLDVKLKKVRQQRNKTLNSNWEDYNGPEWAEVYNTAWEYRTAYRLVDTTKMSNFEMAIDETASKSERPEVSKEKKLAKKCSTHCDWPDCKLPGCVMERELKVEFLLTLIKKAYNEDGYARRGKHNNWIFGYTNDYPLQHGDGVKLVLPDSVVSILYRKP